jgi:putative ABC transport system permease protein
MIRNYFKIALRTLIRNKAFTLINILGLVLGISFSTMLYTYVRHELSYDSFHRKADRTFRILTRDASAPNDIRTLGRTAPPMGPQLVSSFPAVKEMTRLFRLSGQVIVEIAGTKYNERRWFTTPDSNFFDVFDFEFIAGDRQTALREPFSLILTESIAKKYFSDGNALGKTLKTSAGEVKVTGVIKDTPGNSHLQFDLLFSTIRSGKDWTDYLGNWTRRGAFTYVVLDDAKSIDHLQQRMPEFMATYWGADAASQSTQFQPIKDIYLHSNAIEAGAEEAHGQLSYVYIFSSMAVFLLIVAAINYINLTTSKASLRAREIGIRKVAGAFRQQLIFQFLTEAFLVALISMLFSVIVIDLCFPFFNAITGKNFELSLGALQEYLPPLLLITLVIAALAGSYPAFYLSKLRAIVTLKGQPIATKGTFDLRTSLVVFQFTVTIVLIVSTLVISDQMEFIQTKDVGFDKDQMMIIDINSRGSRSQFQAMKTEFARIPGVEHVSVSSNVPGEWKIIEEVYIKPPAETPGADSLMVYFIGADEDMADTYRLKITSGTFFSGSEADSMNIVLNESALKAMNLSDPLGTKVRVSAYGALWEANVIGIVKDFNFQSLHQKVAPMIIGYRLNPINTIDYFSLKVSGDEQFLVAETTKVHEKFDTQTALEYHFLSDQLNRFYLSEKKTGMIFRMAGVLSVLVACLGLLGLASYHVERRTKELGIRKILGAAPLNLFLMVSLSFTKNVLLAFVLACPLAWYMMKEWLGAFEYRIPLRPDAFVLAGLFVFLLVLITVSYQSLKAALFNPIDSLKQE